jgi:mycothiol synthase
MRDLRPEDAEQVAALFNEAWGDARRVDAEEIRTWTRNTELRPEWLRVLELDGRVAGYGDIWPRPDVLELDAAAPGHWDVFLDWAESEAREHAIPQVRTSLAYGHELEGLVSARGYVRWRSSLTMAIALDDVAPPAVPAGIEIRPYVDADEPVLIATVNEAFERDPFWHQVDAPNFRAFYLGARGHDPLLWALAWDGPTLAGCSLAYAGRGSDAALGWIGTLGVLPPWRGRGLGEALLRTSFRDLRARGLRRAGLGVDAQNVTNALRLYERVGMRQVQRQDSWVKAL